MENDLKLGIRFPSLQSVAFPDKAMFDLKKKNNPIAKTISGVLRSTTGWPHSFKWCPFLDILYLPSKLVRNAVQFQKCLYFFILTDGPNYKQNHSCYRIKI